MIKRQRLDLMVLRLKEQVREAYLSGSSTQMEKISTTILEIHNQNRLFMKKNRGCELDLVKKESRQLLNLYSQILVLKSRLRKQLFRIS
ncbi:hypothetical protein LCGC14_1925420 [marine sediment metagenome]|uniref:Uncharacterized protein n=1 Tax=marine sediment metagenome TaxID=412755 RepID=A0A0F9FQ64_9ZZZZ